MQLKTLIIEILSVVETIEKRREPMPAMEAIYLIGSSDASVKCLLQDFSSQNRTTYKFAHVYFTEGKTRECEIVLIVLFQPVLMTDSRRSATPWLRRGSRPSRRSTSPSLPTSRRCTPWTTRTTSSCTTTPWGPLRGTWQWRRWLSRSPPSAPPWESIPPSDTERTLTVRYRA